MSFETWWSRYATGYELRSPWVKAVAKAAFDQGKQYEKSLAKKRKPKETK